MEILALVLASASIVLSVTVPLVLRDKTLRNAFSALEDDFETLRQTVRSDLGRVARLKRGIMRGEIPAQEGTEEGAGEAGSVNGSPLSKGQLAWQQKILARRHQQ